MSVNEGEFERRSQAVEGASTTRSTGHETDWGRPHKRTCSEPIHALTTGFSVGESLDETHTYRMKTMI